MDRLDLLYSGLIYATGGMLILWAGMLLTAAFLVLVPSRKSVPVIKNQLRLPSQEVTIPVSTPLARSSQPEARSLPVT